MSLMDISGSRGCCCLKSVSDPRWNHTWSDVECGGLQMPRVCKDKIEKLRKQLGQVPDDLTWEYDKY